MFLLWQPSCPVQVFATVDSSSVLVELLLPALDFPFSISPSVFVCTRVQGEGEGAGVEAWKLGVPRHCPGMSTSSLLTRPATCAQVEFCSHTNNDRITANSGNTNGCSNSYTNNSHYNNAKDGSNCNNSRKQRASWRKLPLPQVPSSQFHVPGSMLAKSRQAKRATDVSCINRSPPEPQLYLHPRLRSACAPAQGSLHQTIPNFAHIMYVLPKS